jgi:hypothetical protein
VSPLDHERLLPDTFQYTIRESFDIIDLYPEMLTAYKNREHKAGKLFITVVLTVKKSADKLVVS